MEAFRIRFKVPGNRVMTRLVEPAGKPGRYWRLNKDGSRWFSGQSDANLILVSEDQLLEKTPMVMNRHYGELEPQEP